MRLKISGETETRPSVSVYFFTRPRRDPNSDEENDWIFAICFLKTAHPYEDETETKLSKIEANKTRQRQDCLKNFHPRRDRGMTSSKILYETGTRPRVSVHLVLRPKRDRDSRPTLHLCSIYPQNLTKNGLGMAKNINYMSSNSSLYKTYFFIHLLWLKALRIFHKVIFRWIRSPPPKKKGFIQYLNAP